MPADLTALSAAIVTLAATYLLHSTLLLAAAWLGLWAFRVRSHLLTERVWKLAAVTGIVTAALQCSLGLSGSVLNLVAGGERSEPSKVLEPAERHTPNPAPAPITLPEPAIVETPPAEPAEPVEVILPAPEIPETVVVPSKTEPVVVQSDFVNDPLPPTVPDDPIAESYSETFVAESNVEETATEKDAPYPPTPVDALAGLLFFVFLTGLARLLWQRISLHRRLVRYEPMTDGPAFNELAALLRAASLRRPVRLLRSDSQCEPVAFGAFRWTIVLPAGIEHRFDRRELRALLAHEVAHLVRRDALWLGIGGGMCSCLAFQPLNLLARRNWRRAGEYLCDDWAAEHACGLALARCLTRVAEWRLDAKTASVTLAASGNRSQLSQRVERLVEGRTPSDVWNAPGRRRLFGLSAAAVLALFLEFAPRATFSPPSALAAEAGNAVAKNIPPIEPAGDLDEELRLLDRELSHLDAEMQRAGRLLNDLPDDPQIRDLAAGILRKTSELQRRRHALNRLRPSSQ